MRRTRKVNFTLIELLIVMSIISVLASLFMPALQNAMVQTHRINCISQFKQLGLAFEDYSNDYRGMLPHEDSGSMIPPYHAHWYHGLDPYLGASGASLFIKHEQNLSNEFVQNDDILGYSIKFNSRLEDYQGSGPFRRIASIRHTSETVVLFDGRMDTPYYQPRSWAKHTGIVARHGGKVNHTFLTFFLLKYCN